MSTVAERDSGRETPHIVAVSGSFIGALVAGATLVRFGFSGAGVVWAGAQLLLVFLACFDLAVRRVPNRVTLPTMLLIVVLRASFAPSALPQTILAGAVAFAFFLLVALMTRGGIGMGDVKLAGLIGLLLGKAALPGLMIGIIAGGLASLVLLLAGRAGRRQAIAYAPYLCFGGSLAILAFSVPKFV